MIRDLSFIDGEIYALKNRLLGLRNDGGEVFHIEEDLRRVSSEVFAGIGRRLDGETGGQPQRQAVWNRTAAERAESRRCK